MSAAVWGVSARAPKVPLPIVLFGALLVLIGVAAGAGQYVAPEATFAGLPALTPPVASAVWQVGSRSLAQAAALAFALLLRDRRALGVAFARRNVARELAERRARADGTARGGRARRGRPPGTPNSPS
ncbi:MAG TPA: hypothetical protein VFS43_19580 [Polyangiaceae bacterium]|nr:hypothetical protein [Polyangiaceae bacterium]